MEKKESNKPGYSKQLRRLEEKLDLVLDSIRYMNQKITAIEKNERRRTDMEIDETIDNVKLQSEIMLQLSKRESNLLKKYYGTSELV